MSRFSPYVLGYYAPAGPAGDSAAAPTWHDLEVTVSRPDVRVLARPGYVDRREPG